MKRYSISFVLTILLFTALAYSGLSFDINQPKKVAIPLERYQFSQMSIVTPSSVNKPTKTQKKQKVVKEKVIKKAQTPVKTQKNKTPQKVQPKKSKPLKLPEKKKPKAKPIESKKPIIKVEEVERVQQAQPKKQPLKKTAAVTTNQTSKSATQQVPIEQPKPRLNAQQLENIKQNYYGDISSVIKQFQFYPKSAQKRRQQGKVLVSFTILKNGQLEAYEIKTASKYQRLNQAALDIFKNKIKQFKTIPEDLQRDKLTFTIWLNYRL